jgi:MFS family permease
MARVGLAPRWRLLRGILTEPHLLLLFLVVGLAAACDTAVFLATSVVAIDVGGAQAVGLVGAVRVLPGALAIGFVAALADRYSRTLVVAAALAGLSLVTVGMAAMVDADPRLDLLVGLQAVASVAAAFLKPCLHSLLPRLTPLPSQLVQAGAGWSMANGVGSVLGPAAGGAVLASRGARTLYVVLAVVLAVTGLLAAAIRTTYQPARHQRHMLRDAGWWTPLRGLGLFARPGSRVMFGLTLFQHALVGLVSASAVLFAFEVAGSDGKQVSGHLLAAVGAGTLLGSAVTLGADGRHTRWWFAAGVTTFGLPLVVVGLTSSVGVAVVALVVCGAGSAWASIYGSGLITRLLPDHVAGRGWGVLLGLGAGATAWGSLMAPLMANLWGLPNALAAVGILTAVVVLGSVPGLRALAHRTVPPADVLALVERVPVLAPLPGICRERLAVAAVRRAVHAGEIVVSEGEPGEDFFVIEAGELTVSVDGREVRTLGPGDAFGEVALLRRLPRTATVVAAGPGQLLTLDRESFIGTVTGHTTTDAFADSAVEQLLDEDVRRER